MRINSVKLGGFFPFPTPVTIDLASLPGVITALSGENGAGKTTLCELMWGGPYRSPGRSLPTRGLMADLAIAPDAFVETDIDVGSKYRIRHLVDAKANKKSALVTDLATGALVDECPHGGVKEYARWATAKLPDWDVVQASIFLAQGATGILGMEDGDRAAVILRALGAERLERLAVGARKQASAAAASLETLVARLGTLKEEAGDVGVTGPALDSAVASRAAARASLEVAEKELAACQATLEGWRELERASVAVLGARAGISKRLDAAHAKAEQADSSIKDCCAIVGHAEAIRADVKKAAEVEASLATTRAERDRVATARDVAAKEAARFRDESEQAFKRHVGAVDRAIAQIATLREQHQDATARLAALQLKLGNNRKLMADREAILAAVTTVDAIDVKVAALRTTEAKLSAERDALSREVVTAQLQAGQAAQRVATAEASRSAEARRALEAGTVAQAVADLPGVQTNVATLTKALVTAERDLEALRQSRGVGIEERHAKLLAFVQEVARLDEDFDVAGENIERVFARAKGLVQKDREAAELAVALPGRILAAEDARRKANLDLATATEKLSAVRATAERAALVAAAIAEAKTAEDAKHQAAAEELAAKQASATAGARVVSSQKLLDELAKEMVALQAQRATLADRCKYADRLTAAEARVAELEPQIEATNAEILRIVSAIGAVDENGDPEAAAALADAKKAAVAASDSGHREQECAARLRALESEEREAEQVRRRLGDVAARATELVQAEAKLATLEKQYEAAREEVAAITRELDASPMPTLPAKPTGLDVAEAAHRAAVSMERAHCAAVTRAEEAHRRASEAAVKIAALEAERRTVEEDLAGWRALAEDLGRTGLQADLVDGAAPALTERTNELLRSAGVTRWTVVFDSKSTTKDGKKEIDGFTIRVRDEETGIEREARTYSGGETVLLGAAVANAIAVLACQRAGIEGPTLVRDESGAALSPKNEGAWVTMLRKTAAMVGASRILVITHSERVKSLCDSVLHVEDGKVELEAA